jgi:hypothetical protein
MANAWLIAFSAGGNQEFPLDTEMCYVFIYVYSHDLKIDVYLMYFIRHEVHSTCVKKH